jgi:hypothetical protein
MIEDTMSSSKYVIRIYDTPLIVYSRDVSRLGTVTGKVEWLDDELRRLFPMRLLRSCTYDDVSDWLSSRVIPKNRAFVKQLLNQYGVNAEDAQSIIDISKGLSLNDAYWVTPEKFEGTWEDYNLYENKFDEVLGLVAYTGVTDSQKHKAGLSSEWTTSGSYPKAWRNVGDRVVLYKAGNYPLYEGFANDDLGPFSEYFAAQVAEQAGLTHIPYGLDTWKGHLASTCELFTDARHSFVSFYDATKRSGVPDCLATCALFGEKALDSYLDMLVFDSIILNDDRHVGNFGFMRDNMTGALVGFAPLFDQNRSLFPTDMDRDLPDWENKSHFMAPAGSNITFDKLVPSIITERQHEWLRKLLEFSPRQDPEHSVSERRLRAIGRLVRYRASEMLRLPCQDIEDVMKTIEKEPNKANEEEQGEMPIVTLGLLQEEDSHKIQENELGIS